MNPEKQFILESIISKLQSSVFPFSIGLRFYEIRDGVEKVSRLDDKFNYTTQDEMRALGTKVHRNLKYLLKEGMISKNALGHKLVYYYLNFDNFEKAVKTYLPWMLKDDNYLKYFSDDYENKFVRIIIEFIERVSLSIRLDEWYWAGNYDDYETLFLEKVSEILKPILKEKYELIKIPPSEDKRYINRVRRVRAFDVSEMFMSISES